MLLFLDITLGKKKDSRKFLITINITKRWYSRTDILKLVLNAYISWDANNYQSTKSRLWILFGNFEWKLPSSCCRKNKVIFIVIFDDRWWMLVSDVNVHFDGHLVSVVFFSVKPGFVSSDAGRGWYLAWTGFCQQVGVVRGYRLQGVVSHVERSLSGAGSRRRRGSASLVVSCSHACGWMSLTVCMCLEFRRGWVFRFCRFLGVLSWMSLMVICFRVLSWMSLAVFSRVRKKKDLVGIPVFPYTFFTVFFCFTHQ